MAQAGAAYTNVLGVHTFGGTTGFQWIGKIDEVALFSTALSSTAFTPPTAPYADTTPGLVALWHLDGNLLDTATVDTTAPTASAAAVANGAPTVVAITMSEVLDAGFVPAASTFTVSGHTVSSVAFSGAAINLTCSDAFVNGEAARTVSYVQPVAVKARDVAGNLLDSFSGLAITNNVGAADTTAPAFVSAQVTNSAPSVIVLTMNETLAASTPPASAFAVSGGRTVSGVSAPSGTTISLTVSAPYANGDTITVGYTQPGADPRLQDAAANATATFAAQSVTNNIAAAGNNALTGATANVLFSPYNWDIQASTAKTINAGAYFKTIFGGTTCMLNFDMTGIASPLPQISYRVDRFGAWITVPIAASVVITIPAETAGYASKPGHLLEVIVKSMTETQPRWSTQSTAVKLTGIVLDAGKVLSAPPALPLKAIFYGDSITEGVRTVSSTATFDTDRNDAGQCWSLEVGRILGAEVGNVGFGASGWLATGSGSVPNLQTSYSLLYAGVARSFAVSPDFIVLMEGTNDGSSNTTAAATAVLNGLLAATVGTKIVVLRPFNGTNQASFLQAAVAACTAPTRCLYVNTSGFFTTANSSDNLHPYGVENLTHIAPAVSNAIRTFVTGAATPPTLTQRTATITFGTEVNRTGAMVAFYDEPTPNLFTTARYQTALEAIDGSGVMTATYGSTLASGATGGFVIQFADQTSVNGQMVVV